MTERSGYLYKKCSLRSRHMGWVKKWVQFKDDYLKYYSDEKVISIKSLGQSDARDLGRATTKLIIYFNDV